jgi:hypothetical protein
MIRAELRELLQQEISPTSAIDEARSIIGENLTPDSTYHKPTVSYNVDPNVSLSSSSDNSKHVLIDGVLLDCKVDDKTKEDIWKGGYFDLIKLKKFLNTPFSSSSQKPNYGSLTLLEEDSEFNDGEKQHLLVSGKREKIKHIHEWLDLFTLYMYVYLEKPAFAAEGRAMLVHMHHVRELALLNGSWSDYDENFRASRARSQVPWDTEMSRLYSLAMNRKQAPNNSRNTAQSQYSSNQEPCRLFNMGKCTKHFSRCFYTHKCTYCSLFGHPELKCRKKETRQQNQGYKGNFNNKFPNSLKYSYKKGNGGDKFNAQSGQRQ